MKYDKCGRCDAYLDPTKLRKIIKGPVIFLDIERGHGMAIHEGLLYSLVDFDKELKDWFAVTPKLTTRIEWPKSKLKLLPPLHPGGDKRLQFNGELLNTLSEKETLLTMMTVIETKHGCEVDLAVHGACDYETIIAAVFRQGVLPRFKQVVRGFFNTQGKIFFKK